MSDGSLEFGAKASDDPDTLWINRYQTLMLNKRRLMQLCRNRKV